jgi:hypothetical protein
MAPSAERHAPDHHRRRPATNYVPATDLRSGLIATFVLTLSLYKAKQQFVNASQLVRRSGWLDQTRTNTDKVGE